MSEEEKEAIEYLKARLYGNAGCKFIDVAQEDLRIMLKLIEKQQKEIEKMREELQMYVDTNLMKEKLEREIEKLKGIHKEFLKLHQELKAEDTFLSADNIIKAIRKNYISKYKIRELIKEKEKQHEIYAGREYSGMGELVAEIKILEKLLEE